jgi:hypothetical protein
MERPIEINNRPFAIEPITSIMLPDGIFDSTVRSLEIAFHLTNRSTHRLKFAWVRPNLSSKTGWFYSGNNFTEFRDLEPGVSRLVRWPAVFAECGVGKWDLDIELGGGFDGLIRKQIFVSRTTQDSDTGEYFCQVPEGTLRLKLGRRTTIGGWTSKLFSPDGEVKEIVIPSTNVIEQISGSVTSAPGSEEKIPFNDPWWKIVAWIVFVLAGIGAIIAAKEGKGTASIGIGGEEDAGTGNPNWCVPDPGATQDKFTLAGMLSMVASTAFRVGMMDKRDPIQKGRDRFPFTSSDPRVIESLDAEIQLPNRLAAGEVWNVPIHWKYTGIRTSGKVDVEQRSEIGETENAVTNVTINLPSSVPMNSPIVLRIYAENKHNIPLPGDALFASVSFISPSGHVFKVPLENKDAINGQALEPGKFEAMLHTEVVAGQYGAEFVKGQWKAQIYGQKVNCAPEGLSPFVAAEYVGGDFLFAPLAVTRPDDSEGAAPTCQPDKALSTYVS